MKITLSRVGEETLRTELNNKKIPELLEIIENYEDGFIEREKRELVKHIIDNYPEVINE